MEETSWLIPFEELEMEKEVGRGAYGRVFRARHLHTTVAAKQVSKEKKSSNEEFEREVTMLKRLRHPNIVLFMGVSETDTDFYIVQEFVAGGGMNNLIRNQSIVWPWPTRVRMALEVSQALLYLHTKNVLHRDIKCALVVFFILFLTLSPPRSENVFLDRNTEDAGVEQQRCKVADFGLSLLFAKGKGGGKALDNAGTGPWKAPEVNLRDYDTRADIFSFGMMLAEMAARVYGTRVRELINNKTKPDERGYVGLDSKRLLTAFPASRHHYPPELMNLAVQMCTENPDERITLLHAVETLEALFQRLEESEREALEALGGDEAGAKMWVSVSAEHSSQFADCSYLATIITDRLWDLTNRNLNEAENRFLCAVVPKERLELPDFVKFWSFYAACEKIILNRSILPLWKADFIGGFCGKEETIAFLEKSPSGTFVTRFTTSAPGKLALSYTAGGKVSHLMVAVNGDGGGFVIGTVLYASFSEILEKSRVFTHVHPDKPIASFQASLEEAAGKQKVALNCYGSELPANF